MAALTEANSLIRDVVRFALSARVLVVIALRRLFTEEAILSEERTTDEEKKKIIEGSRKSYSTS